MPLTGTARGGSGPKSGGARKLAGKAAPAPLKAALGATKMIGKAASGAKKAMSPGGARQAGADAARAAGRVAGKAKDAAKQAAKLGWAAAKTGAKMAVKKGAMACIAAWPCLLTVVVLSLLVGIYLLAGFLLIMQGAQTSDPAQLANMVPEGFWGTVVERLQQAAEFVYTLYLEPLLAVAVALGKMVWGAANAVWDFLGGVFG